MKTTFVNLIKGLLVCLFGVHMAMAQTALTPVQNPAIGLDSTLAYVFEHARLDLVPSGYLQDLAVGFENLSLYNGAKNSGVMLYPDTWRRLYATLMTGACNANAQALPDISQLNKRLRQAATTDTVPILGFDWHYDDMDSLAAEKGNASVINDQVYVATNKVNQVYQERRLFAVCQGLRNVAGPHVVFTFDAAQWLSNTGQPVTGLEVDFDNGQGFVAISMGSSYRVFYSQPGLKNITWRVPGAVVLPNGALQMYRYSYSQLWVAKSSTQTAVTYEETPDLTLAFPRWVNSEPRQVQPYNGRVAQATVSISYGSGNNTGFLQKPLIVLEGFDVWHITDTENPEQDYDYNDYLLSVLDKGLQTPYDSTFLARLHIEGYDLVFVNWARGATHIQEHAYLTAQIIQWVNDNKAFGGSTEPNVLLGYSMGGLVGRYALAAMEQNTYYTQQNISHDVRLFASIDAPHQGAIVPLGAMAMVQHLGNSSIKTNWPFERARNLAEFSQDLRAAYISYNSLAAKQMLRYRVVGNNGGLRIDSTAHNQFTQELQALGYPQQSRNIALSNGSQCGRGQAAGFAQTLIDIQGNVSTGILADVVLGALHAPGVHKFRPAILETVGVVVNNAKQVRVLPVMAYVPNLFTSYKLAPQFKVQTMGLAGQSNEVYQGKFVVKKCLLRVICIRKNLLHQSLKAPANLLRWEQAPGGAVTNEFIDVGQQPINIGNDGFLLNNALSQSIDLPPLNFVPTVSALDLGRGQVTYSEADLYRSFSPQNPPPLNLASPFDAIFTASRSNESHILSTRLNATWLFSQMQQAPVNTDCRSFCNATPRIITGSIFCVGDTLTATMLNQPDSSFLQWVPIAGVDLLSNSVRVDTGRFVVTGNTDSIKFAARIRSDCGFIQLFKTLAIQPSIIQPERIGSGPVGTTNNQLVYCQGEVITLALTTPILTEGLSTEWVIPCGTIESSNATSVKVRWQNEPCNQPLQVRISNLCGQKSFWLTKQVTLNTPPNCQSAGGPADAIAIATFRSSTQPTLSIVPNPSTQGQAVQLQVSQDIPTALLANAQIRIYNAQGFKVLQRRWPNGKRRVQYAAKQMPAGIYTIQLVYSQGTISTRWVKE